MQYIVNFDIENSRIFVLKEVNYNKRTSPYIKQGDEELWKYYTELLARGLDQDRYDFIYNENYEKAKKGIKYISELYKADYAKQTNNERKVCGLKLVPYTHKYLSNYLIYKVQPKPIKKLTIDNDILRSEFAFTPQDDLDILNSLIDKWLDGNDILFCAHNLKYEYNYLRFNVPEFIERLKKNATDYKVLADSSTKIKSIEFVWGIDKEEKEDGTYKIINPHKFIIRDTYLMTNKSIDDLGTSFGLPKLEYDYEKTRLTRKDLIQHDFKYNMRDNEIALRALLDLQEQNPDYIDITKMPISQTQHYKNECKHNPNVNKQYTYKKKKGKTTLQHLHKMYAHEFNMPNHDLYVKFFSASGGGVIGVNPLFTRKWIKDCLSFDIKSAHPSQSFTRSFPLGYNTEQITDKEEINGIYNYIKSIASWLKNEPKDCYNNFNPDYDYLFNVTFINLREHEYPNGNVINTLGSGTIDIRNDNFDINGLKASRSAHVKSYIRKDLDTENKYFAYGKVRQVPIYNKWFFGIDLIYHIVFYDYDDIKINSCYKYKLRKCDEYTHNEYDEYAGLKEIYKKFSKRAKKCNYEEFMEEIKRETKIQDFTKNVLEAHKEDYAIFMANELLRIKGIFNGIFGQNYQNIYHIGMDFGDDYAICKSTAPDYYECLKNTSVHYCQGAYTAAWTRFELACMIVHVINKGGTCLYWATDSVKACNVSKSIFDNWYDELKKIAPYGDDNIYGFGGVDCEYEEPVDVYILETLKYITLSNKDGFIKVNHTISGFKAEVFLENILAKKYEFNDENLEKIKNELTIELKPQMIPPERTGKLAQDLSYVGDLTPLGQRNFGALVAIGFNLLNYNADFEDYEEYEDYEET